MEFEKYHKIKILGDPENKDIFLCDTDKIISQEKMDGSNFRFYINSNEEIVFGSRNLELTEDRKESLEQFQSVIRYIKEKLKGKDLGQYKNMIFYGEAMMAHTIKYDFANMPRFLGFDIKRFEDDKIFYLDYPDIKDIFDDLDLPMVPILFAGSAKEFKKDDINSLVPISKYIGLTADDRLAEGIVIKNYTRQIFAKFVREKFKEKARIVFCGSKKFATNDNELIVAKYCTEARIEKTIFKLTDEGHKIDMKMTGFLIKAVVLDIFEEEWKEILMSNYIVDCKKIRNLIAKRCLETLKRVIINNAL